MGMGRRGLVIVCLAAALGACASTKPDASSREATVDVAAARDAGEAAYAAGDWRAAMPHYQKLVRAIPQDADLWFRLGNIYARNDEPDLAVNAYREALVRDGDMAKAWFNMGIVHLRQAANSFNKMQVHTDTREPMAVQGSEAYQAIMAILGQQATDVTGSSTVQGDDQASP